MCGIAGIFSHRHPISTEKLLKMRDVLTHRGPNDNGYIVFGDTLGLVHTRLSIIDLSDAAHQPFTSKDRRFAISYNGELYNYKELRKNLTTEGVKFYSQSDTEVVLQSYITWGKDALHKFNGMFSFAIWDNKRKKLVLARDRFGIKPLYYFYDENNLIFSSEIKAILTCLNQQMFIDYQGLSEYIWYGNTISEHTLFNKINKLAPGCYLTINQDGLSASRYWSLPDPLTSTADKDSVDMAKKNIREKLEQAVVSHLQADVPVGVFLSGGIDSSAITAFASRHYHNKLKTYSVSFDFNDGHNELSAAAEVAKLFGTQHNEVHIRGCDLHETIENLVGIHDEPFADAANIPLYLLCNQLKSSIRVILQGDGGDELFGGYRKHKIFKHEYAWHLASYFFSWFRHIMPSTKKMDYINQFFYALRQPDSYMRMALLPTKGITPEKPFDIFLEQIQHKLLQQNPFLKFQNTVDSMQYKDSLQRLLYADCQIQLPTTFLEKVDKATMAFSVESRVPFLDNILSEYALQLPSKFKVHQGQTKWILREAMRGILPDTILDAPKRGFGVPFSNWLRGPLAEYMQDTFSNMQPTLFKKSSIEKLVYQHLHGEKDYGFILWRLLHLAIWQRKYKIAFD